VLIALLFLFFYRFFCPKIEIFKALVDVPHSFAIILGSLEPFFTVCTKAKLKKKNIFFTDPVE
jgi:hypothetical protein